MTPYKRKEVIGNATLYEGDALAVLSDLPDQSVQCCVTSPPYWGLRSYIADGDPLKPLEQGSEPTPAEYVEKMVAVFREVKRVLRDDGTLWLNLGSSYASSGMGGNPDESEFRKQATNAGSLIPGRSAPHGFKPKDMVPIPWMVAMALQADGWYLRQDVIWAKPNPMPESVRDRCTKSHEYLFLLAKSEKYYFDADAIREAFADDRMGNPGDYAKTSAFDRGVNNDRKDGGFIGNGGGWNSGGETTGRNKRSVWTVTPEPFKGAHFATFPPKLIEPCILAGCPAGGVVLDCFNGSGTTGLVALQHGRQYVGIELNPEYLGLTMPRIENAQKQERMFA